MITLYDSDNPDSIPDGVAAAGYCDGYAAAAWNARGWNRFPGALRIAVFSTTNDGDVGDVERGDMLPWELPDWIQMRRAAGHPNPWGYVNLSNWGPTKTEFELRGIPEPPWWVADYDGIPEIMPGAIAKQYANQTIIPGNPHYDLSVTIGDDEMRFVIGPTPPGIVLIVGPSVRHIGPQEWAYWRQHGFTADAINQATLDEFTLAIESGSGSSSPTPFSFTGTLTGSGSTQGG